MRLFFVPIFVLGDPLVFLGFVEMVDVFTSQTVVVLYQETSLSDPEADQLESHGLESPFAIPTVDLVLRFVRNDNR